MRYQIAGLYLLPIVFDRIFGFLKEKQNWTSPINSFDMVDHHGQLFLTNLQRSEFAGSPSKSFEDFLTYIMCHSPIVLFEA